MELKPLHYLPPSTITLIGSSQVIISVYSVIKELLENSIDAEATSLDVKIENYGLDKIEVCDNGSGIRAVDIPFLAKRHCTSKISNTEDLKTLESYGFRGEALASLCEVSDMKVTTRTANDDLSYTYSFDQKGNVTDKKPSHLGQGTMIIISKLFNNLPVRKQYYASSQKKKEDLKKIEELLMAYGMIKPSLRLILRHGKELIWQKLPSKDIKDALHSVFTRPVASQLIMKEKAKDDCKMKVTAYVPKPGSDAKIMSRSLADRTFIAVNNRPVIIKELLKVLKLYYNNCHPCDVTRFPVCFVCVSLPSSEIDINVDPNKTTIFIQNMREVQVCLEEILLEMYGPLDDVPSWHYTSSEETQQDGARHPEDDKNRKNITEFQLSAQFSKTENLNEVKIYQNTLPVCNNKSEYAKYKEGNNNLFFKEKSNQWCEEKSDAIDKDNEIVSPKKVNDATSQNILISSQLPNSFIDDPIFESSFLENSDSDQNENRKCDKAKEDKLISNSEDNLILLHSKNVSDLEQTDASTKPNKNIADTPTMKVINNWSRGNCVYDFENNLVQPIQLLAPTSRHNPGKHLIDDDENEKLECLAKRRKTTLYVDAKQPTLQEAFNKTAITVESSGFEKFSQQEKVLETSHDHHNEDVLKTLLDNICDTEKMKYSLRSEKNEVKKDLIKNIKTLKNVQPAIREQIVAMVAQSQAEKSKKVLKKKTYPSERIVKFDVAALRTYVRNVNLEQQNCSRFIFPILTVIGQTKIHETWLCGFENTIFFVSVNRLSEVTIYKKLQATFRLCAKPCLTPIPLDPRNVSETMWSTLKLLAYASRTQDTFFLLTDERIVANGFNVRCCFDSQNNLKAEIVGLNDLIPAYSVDDFTEVLQLINKNSSASLKDVRSTKAQYYLQGEAVRIHKQNMTNKSTSDVLAMLKSFPIISENIVCLHHKPLFYVLMDLTDL